MLLGIAILRGDAARWTFNAPGLMALSYSYFHEFLPGLHSLRMADTQLPRRRSSVRTAYVNPAIRRTPRLAILA